MKWLAVVATGFVVTAVARADGANPFLLVEMRRPVYRIESAESHPNAVLFLFEMTYGRGNQVSATRIELPPDRPVILEPAPERYQLLVLVPKSGLDRFGSDLDAAIAATDGKIDGASTLKIQTQELIPVWSRFEAGQTVTYQIRATPTGSLEFHRTTPDPMRQWYVAAGSLTLGIVAGGAWLARRLVRRRVASRQRPA